MSRELSDLREYAEANDGITDTASELGVSKAVLWAWINRGQVPADRAPAVGRATGISLVRLRPNDWWLIWPELAEKHPDLVPKPEAA